MKKEFTFLLLMIFFTSLTFGQATTTFWKTYDDVVSIKDECHSAQPTSDGGYILCGRSSVTGSSGIFLVKTDIYGDTLWTKTYEGGQGWAVQQTSDGGYIIASQSIIRTDSYGNVLWSKSYDNRGGYTIQQTADGGFIFGGWDNWNTIVKIDGYGNHIWTKGYLGLDGINSVRQTTDGGYIIAGLTTSFGAGSGDFYLIKTDFTGNVVWSKAYGGPDYEIPFSVRQTTDGGYILVGYTKILGSVTYSDVYVVKTDGNGTMLWSKTFGGTMDDDGYSVQQTPDGGYIISGPSWSFGPGGFKMYLIRITGTGNLLWSKCYGNSGSTFAVTGRRTNDGGFMIAGMNNNKFCLVKTDTSGLVGTGCELTAATVETIPPTIETTVADTGFSITPVVTNIPKIIGSGADVFTICTSCTPNLAKIMAAGPTTFCSGDSVTLNAPILNYFSYQWKKGGVNIPGAHFSSYTATTGGNYKVTVTSTTIGCSQTTSSATTVTVNPLPNPTITPQGPTTFCAGGSVLLKANYGAGFTYQWKKGGNNISGATLKNYTASLGGVYKVKETNSSGCNKLSGGVTVSVPCKEEEDVTSLTGLDVSVFPNPAHSEINIVLPGNDNFEIEVVSTYGSTMVKAQNQNSIDISKLANGIYFLKVLCRDHIVMQKFIKH